MCRRSGEKGIDIARPIGYIEEIVCSCFRVGLYVNVSSFVQPTRSLMESVTFFFFFYFGERVKLFSAEWKKFGRARIQPSSSTTGVGPLTICQQHATPWWRLVYEIYYFKDEGVEHNMFCWQLVVQSSWNSCQQSLGVGVVAWRVEYRIHMLLVYNKQI